jgi:hypothetical protein
MNYLQPPENKWLGPSLGHHYELVQQIAVPPFHSGPRYLKEPLVAPKPLRATEQHLTTSNGDDHDHFSSRV